MSTPHEIMNPEGLAPPRGFSHTLIAAPGTMIFLGGQTAHDADGSLRGSSVAEQFDAAASNVVTALQAAGAGPEHLVSLQIFVTDADEYRSALAELGRIYRSRFGDHYPATALFEVKGLFDPGAKVELVCTAVVPLP